MNTISELNSWGQTSVNYTDDRNPAVIFDRAAGLPQTAGAAIGQSFQGPIGIDIVEIVKPDDLNIYYEVDVTSVAGATVTWPSVPAGVTVTNPSVGIYRVTNIDTLVQWQQIRYPTINLPGGWEEDFTYTSYIRYDPSQVKSWTTTVTVGIGANLVSTAGCSATLSGIQRSFVTTGSTSSLSCLGGFPNQASASLTAQVNLTFDFAVVKFGAVFVTNPFTLTLTPTRRRPLSASLSSLAAITNIAYSRVRRYSSSMSSSFTKSSIIGEGFTLGSLVTGSYTEFNYGNYYPRSDTLGAVLNSSGQFRRTGSIDIYNYSSSTWSLQTTLKPDQTYIDSVSSTVAGFFGFGTSTQINSNGNWVVTLCPEQNSGQSEIYTFERIGNTWFRRDRIYLGATYGVFALQGLMLSSDGNYMALPATATNLMVWSRSGSSFSLQQQLAYTAPSGYSQVGRAIKSDGSQILLQYSQTANPKNLAFQVFGRSGSTWSLSYTSYLTLPELHTETVPFGVISQINLNQKIASVSSDFNYLVIRSVINTKNVLYIIDKTTTTFTVIQRSFVTTGFGLYNKITNTSPLTVRAYLDSSGAPPLSPYAYYSLTKI